ncbi:hypothetical protein Hypma_010632 [Hypsizygus marmoreus]|uniref:RNase III domain-containing protein n=1 Tax=Hypsizygus marmoreus TaxID=39966 RepID=A0A369JR67_HYPMA|nr:hypothetical protein Hypma_010632 [Hypsizygus marmoreus]
MESSSPVSLVAGIPSDTTTTRHIDNLVFQAVMRFMLDPSTPPFWILLPLPQAKWQYIFSLTREAHDSLELIGDLLFASALYTVLHQVFPDRESTFYSHIHNVLCRNQVFAALFFNAGVPLAVVQEHTKSFADIFEVTLAVYIGKGDIKPLEKWVKKNFRPLLMVACKVLDGLDSTIPPTIPIDGSPIAPTLPIEHKKRPRTEASPPVSPPPPKRPRRQNVLGELTNSSSLPFASSSQNGTVAVHRFLPALNSATPSEASSSVRDESGPSLSPIDDTNNLCSSP